MNIKEILKKANLEQYLKCFEKHCINEENIHLIEEHHLKEIGISALGHRLTIIDILKKAKASESIETNPKIDKKCEISDKLEIFEIYPLIIAYPLSEYLKEPYGTLKLWFACDLIEILFRVTTIVGLSEAYHTSKINLILKELKGKIEIPTMGKWLELSEIVVGKKISLENFDGLYKFAKMVLNPFVKKNHGKGPEHSFINLRNQLAHGGGLSKNVSKKLCKIWENKLDVLINEMKVFKNLHFITMNRNNKIIEVISKDAVSKEFDYHKHKIVSKDNISIKKGRVYAINNKCVVEVSPFLCYWISGVNEIDSDFKDKPTTQIYSRKGMTSLEYTPIGENDICQTYSDLDFVTLFDKIINYSYLPPYSFKFRVRPFDDIIEKESAKLIGRSKEIEIIKNIVINQDEGIYWITGPAGCGKSALISRSIFELRSEKIKKSILLPYFFRVGDDRCSKNIFLQYTFERLAAISKDKKTKTKIASGKVNLDLHFLKNVISEIKLKVVFILDGIDEINEVDPTFLRLPFEVSMENALWICSGRSEKGITDVFKKTKCNHVFKNGLPKLRQENIRSMIIEKIGPLRKKLLRDDRLKGDNEVHPFIEKVVEYSEGLPLYVNYIIGDILSNKITSFGPEKKLPPSISK